MSLFLVIKELTELKPHHQEAFILPYKDHLMESNNFQWKYQENNKQYPIVIIAIAKLSLTPNHSLTGLT